MTGSATFEASSAGRGMATDLSELLAHRQRVCCLPHVVAGGTDVDLRRAQRGVPEQRLHDVHRLTAVDELHRDRVPESVGRRPLGERNPRPLIPAPNMMVEGGWLQRLPATVEPHGSVPARAALRAVGPTCEIRLEGLDDLRGEGTRTCSASLPTHTDIRVLDIQNQIANTQTAQLARSHAGSHQQRGDRDIALGPDVASFGIRSRGCAQYSCDLGIALDVTRERPGSRLPRRAPPSRAWVQRRAPCGPNGVPGQSSIPRIARNTGSTSLEKSRIPNGRGACFRPHAQQTTYSGMVPSPPPGYASVREPSADARSFGETDESRGGLAAALIRRIWL